jgi:hypothetical protein
MKHPLVGVCRLVAEGGNQSPAGRQEDSLVAVLHYRQLLRSSDEGKH